MRSIERWLRLGAGLTLMGTLTMPLSSLPAAQGCAGETVRSARHHLVTLLSSSSTKSELRASIEDFRVSYVGYLQCSNGASTVLQSTLVPGVIAGPATPPSPAEMYRRLDRTHLGTSQNQKTTINISVEQTFTAMIKELDKDHPRTETIRELLGALPSI